MSCCTNVIVGSIPEVFIPSPAGSIELILNLPHALTCNLMIRVYSVDGRLVTRYDTEDIQAGRTSFLLSGESEFPTGMYTVCIDGLDTGELVNLLFCVGNNIFDSRCDLDRVMYGCVDVIVFVLGRYKACLDI